MKKYKIKLIKFVIVLFLLLVVFNQPVIAGGSCSSSEGCEGSWYDCLNCPPDSEPFTGKGTILNKFCCPKTAVLERSAYYDKPNEAKGICCPAGDTVAKGYSGDSDYSPLCCPADSTAVDGSGGFWTGLTKAKCIDNSGNDVTPDTEIINSQDKSHYCPTGTCRGGNINDKWEDNKSGCRCFEHSAKVLGDDDHGGTYYYCDGNQEPGTWVASPPTEPGPSPSPSDSVKKLTCIEICEGEEGERLTQCLVCVCDGDNYEGTKLSQNIWTELGCIEATLGGIIIAVMRVFFGVVTGLAIIRFIQAGFMLNTDDPEKIKEGKSIAVSAVAAIIFGAMIPILLNFVGLDILGIGELFTFAS